MGNFSTFPTFNPFPTRAVPPLFLRDIGVFVRCVALSFKRICGVQRITQLEKAGWHVPFILLSLVLLSDSHRSDRTQGCVYVCARVRRGPSGRSARLCLPCVSGPSGTCPRHTRSLSHQQRLASNQTS